MNYDLSEMVRMSQLIAIVVPAQPPMYEKDISYKKKWEQLSDDLKKLPLSNPDIPPYKQLIFCFVIKSVLEGDRKIGERIEVISANDGISQTAHFNYYALGMNMSNNYDHYQPKYMVNEEGEQIVFLRSYEDKEASYTQDPFDLTKNSQSIKLYQFIANGGHEGLEAKPEIERLIKESKSTDFWQTPAIPEAWILETPLPHPFKDPAVPLDNLFDDPFEKPTPKK